MYKRSYNKIKSLRLQRFSYIFCLFCFRRYTLYTIVHECRTWGLIQQEIILNGKGLGKQGQIYIIPYVHSRAGVKKTRVTIVANVLISSKNAYISCNVLLASIKML